MGFGNEKRVRRIRVTTMVSQDLSSGVTMDKLCDDRCFPNSRVTRDQLLARAAGLVFISNELAQLRHYQAGPTRRIAIGNGIRLSDYPTFPAPSNTAPRIAFIGHPGSVWHGLDHLLGQVVVDRNLELDLGQEIHHIFGAAVQLRVTFLAPKTFDLSDRDALHTNLGQRFAHVVELEGLDDCNDKLHQMVSQCGPALSGGPLQCLIK